MTFVRDIYRFIDLIAPFSSQESWDNSGLLVGDKNAEVRRAVVALDITGAVVKEAEEMGAALIVSHHPVIFDPLRRLSADSIPYQLARGGISAICAHTNLDIAPDGVNETLAKTLGLNGVRPLIVEKKTPFYKVTVFCPRTHTAKVRESMAQAGAGTLGNYAGCSFSCAGEGRFTPEKGANPFLGEQDREECVAEDRLEMLCAPGQLDSVIRALKAAHPYEMPAYDVVETHAVTKDTALGLIGELASPLPEEEFAQDVLARLQSGGLRMVASGRRIKRVAVQCGAGGSLVEAAADAGADAFVTGDVKHNQLLLAQQRGITLLDAGHFPTENLIVAPLTERLSRAFPDVEFFPSAAFSDPARFVCTQR